MATTLTAFNSLAATIAAAVCFLATVGQAAPLAVDNNTTHDGTVVSAGAGKLVMTKAGGKEQSFSVGENATISRNGEPAKLEDFKAGDAVRVTVDEQGTLIALSTLDVDKRSRAPSGEMKRSA